MSDRSISGQLRVIVAGGGTGGHLYPGMAVGEALAALPGGVEILYVGAKGGMEETILSSGEYRAVFLPGYGLRGSSVAAWIKAPFVLAVAVARALGVVRSFRPDVVIGTGGYASVAVVVAAMLLRVPRILQEQNSVPGLVNRRLARFADVVLLSYAESKSWMRSARRTVVIGNPLRAMERIERSEAARRLGLDAARKTVLVIGGSRGARSVNTAAAQAARTICQRGDTQILMLTGSLDYERVREDMQEMEECVHVLAYLDDVATAYSLADVAVARAGASSVFELANFGVPTIFVPYPHAADQHQQRNVRELEQRNAAVVVADADLTGERLRDEIEAL
ncbi:MAG: undecaprenyldiphospho-muramoylpentapeptide beta-N-acetylglucosaminyltransferase, partial [Candidatus Krumholzibacteriota bacterium]|nr:undecaprenyldiphospho-muramoylpentapeptide beta-N-acetylglucosaminyltransferase [Candidatus Krumholzibacteriota bacterium]